MKGREGEKLHPLCWHFKEGVPSERQSQGRGCLTDRTGPRAPCILFNKEAFCGQSCRSVNYPDWARAGAVYWALLLSRLPEQALDPQWNHSSALWQWQRAAGLSEHNKDFLTAPGRWSWLPVQYGSDKGKRKESHLLTRIFLSVLYCFLSPSHSTSHKIEEWCCLHFTEGKLRPRRGKQLVQAFSASGGQNKEQEH